MRLEADVHKSIVASMCPAQYLLFHAVCAHAGNGHQKSRELTNSTLNMA